MKQIILAILLTVFSSFYSYAQQKPDPKGYWVVESNVKTPKESVVYFYSQSHELMHTEKISKKKVNINRPRIVRKLNAALEEIALAWKEKKEINFMVKL